MHQDKNRDFKFKEKFQLKRLKLCAIETTTEFSLKKKVNKFYSLVFTSFSHHVKVR